MSICKRVTEQEQKRQENGDTWEEADNKGDSHGRERLQWNYCFKWNLWFICLIGIPFMSFWTQFAWKQVNYLVGTQWPVPASPGILTSQEVFPAKEVKGKSCFSRRKIQVAVMVYIYPAQLRLKMSPDSSLKMHSAIFPVLVKPQANFLGREVPRVFQRGQVLVSFSRRFALPGFSPLSLFFSALPRSLLRPDGVILMLYQTSHAHLSSYQGGWIGLTISYPNHLFNNSLWVILMEWTRIKYLENKYIYIALRIWKKSSEIDFFLFLDT